MLDFCIGNYQITAKVYESENSLVYRGIRQSDRAKVILKLLKANYSNAAELRSYQQEYEIAYRLNQVEGVSQVYGQEMVERIQLLVFEDCGGQSLQQWREGRSINLQEFLGISIKITQILDRIHKHHIIHKDINPTNIIINPETDVIKIIDFGISTLLSRENPNLKNPDTLEGTLAYLSPEQTGRMNRALDYRTDFYSLGVTLYELITGQLPFESQDTLELVHCHIAKQPTPPHEINPILPLGVSQIILKLMAKGAEDRYQSAFGLLSDLQTCLQQLTTSGTIKNFDLGTQDISDRFQIPQKLYGRDREIETLLDAFDRVSQGNTELMLVTGYSGIGKSSLVAEVYKPITKTKGYFIAGKFEQFQRNIPYAAIIEAFRGLIRELLTENEERLNQWKQKLNVALGVNGQIIIDVIPEVELIIGPQPPVPTLGLTESQNRFNLVFKSFIQVFCSQEHPLVVFLDDLQWSDSASLQFMELILSDSELEYLFLIIAYRDNEVDLTHPVVITIENLRKQAVIIHKIDLVPLTVAEVSQLIAETLHNSYEAVQPLANLVVKMTEGNPFFINELLKTLHSDGLIRFKHETHRWDWDLVQIQSMGFMDDVVELIIRKVQQLPHSTQTVLALAACIGTEFNLDQLAMLKSQSPEEIFKTLSPAIQGGLIIPISGLDNRLLIQDYKFGHDRIQQAANTLLNADQKKRIHYDLGQDLLNKTPEELLPEKSIEIVKHLNWGIEFCQALEQKYQLAYLNLMAGRKAKGSAAYQSAWEYFSIGVDLLNNDKWKQFYEILLDLYLEKIQLSYLLGNYEVHEDLAAVALENSKNRSDQIRVYEVKLQALKSRNRFQESLELGLQVLKLLEISFPEEHHRESLEIALVQLQMRLQDLSIDDLLNLPLIQDPDREFAIRIMSELLPAVYHCNPGFFPFLVFKQIHLALDWGHSPAHAHAYTCYGMVLCSLGNIEMGYQAGRLALQLVDKLNIVRLRPSVNFLLGYFCNSWKMHPRQNLPLLRNAYFGCLEIGDTEKACFSIQRYCLYRYFAGFCPLGELEQELKTYCRAIDKLNQVGEFKVHYLYHQLILNLMALEQDSQGNTDPCCLNGSSLDRNEIIHQSHVELTLYHLYFNEAILCYLFQNHHQAMAHILEAEKYLSFQAASPMIPLFHFYKSLINLKLYSLASEAGQSDRTDLIIFQVTDSQEKLLSWASHAPMNLQHKYDLVEAEKARVLGLPWDAIQAYERSIQGAKNNEYLQEEALAYELAAQFYLDQHLNEIAYIYMKKACDCYEHWQAWAKVNHLQKQYPPLLTRFSSPTQIQDLQTVSTTTARRQSKETLDLVTVMKASQAVAKEISLDKLLAQLMKILIQGAGAQRGYLLLEKEGVLLIEASGQAESELITVLQSTPIGNYLPLGIINYVTRTHESLVLEEAITRGNFINDPYIKQQQSRSILCAPLLNQTHLSGLIYLENNLTSGVFTADRLELVQLLSGQAVISIENARLYASLEQKVADRTQALSEAITTLKATQKELIQSEKMAALGQLIAGIAHEINTPLGAIRSSVQYISNFLQQSLDKVPTFFRTLSQSKEQEFLRLLYQSLESGANLLSGRERRRTRKMLTEFLNTNQVDDAETIANLLLDLGIYQELERLLPIVQADNNQDFLKMLRYFIRLQQSTRDIAIASDRAAKVVFALKTYARYDKSGDLLEADVIEGIEAVLTLYHNQIKHGVEVIREYGDDLPRIWCYFDELNQVWTNLIHNALQAMENKGLLTIAVASYTDCIEVKIHDTGPGIPKQIQDQIFEPFFTTKPPGEGSGLGLDIVRKIVEKHSGKIEFSSTPGSTTFRVTLPIFPKRPDPSPSD